MSNGRDGGFLLLEDYTLNKTLLLDNESGSILLALKTMQAAKYLEIDTVLEKVSATDMTQASRLRPNTGGSLDTWVLV